MLVNNKIYQALFYQIPDWEKTDTAAVQEKIRNGLLGKFTEEELQHPSEEFKNELQRIMLDFLTVNALTMKPVWFMIDKDYEQYRILMYYDNVYNQALGEDL